MKFRIQTLCFCWAVMGFAAIPAARAQDADLLARIKTGKTMTIATEARFAPFEFVRDGKIVGYDVDLLNYVMEKHLPDVRIKQLDIPFQGLLPGLDAKKFDFAATAIAVNKPRMARFAFTVPVAESTVALLKRRDDPSLAALEDLSGKTIGSQTGSGQLRILQNFNQRLIASGKPGLKAVKQYISFEEAYADLANRRLDGVAQSLSNLGPVMSSRPGMFAVIEPMLGPTGYYGWMGRKDADSASLVKLFNDGLAEANRDGTMARLQRKWFGFEMAVPADAMPIPDL